MNPTVILCPGQGAQAVGMAKAWYESSREAKAVFEEADSILGDSLGETLSTICLEGPVEMLNKTNVSQPAIFTASAACLAGVRAKLGDLDDSIAATAGLSLGEYTALHIAGAMSFKDGLKLVALRGRAMQEAAEMKASGMVALIGADEFQADAVCDLARADDILVCANFNAPGQVVISGGTAACQRATTEAESAGLKVTQLPVAGAFHSPIMQPAAEQLEKALKKVKIAEPRCPVLSNVTGKPHEAGASGSMADSIRARLVEQLTSPVRWSDCCEWLVEHVSGQFVELSPGKSLAGLMRRIDRGTKVQSYDKPDAVS